MSTGLSEANFTKRIFLRQKICYNEKTRQTAQNRIRSPALDYDTVRRNPYELFRNCPNPAVLPEL